MCVGWFRLQYPAVGKLLFAVPNGGARSRTEAAIMKAEGVTAGVTDLILLLGRGGFNALCIEMKTTDRRSALSNAQIEWRSLAITNGNRHVVCRTFEEFQSEIRWYMARPANNEPHDEITCARPIVPPSIEEIIRIGVAVDFNQGLDARRACDDAYILDLLARVKWTKQIRFACDQMSQLEAVTKCVKELGRRGIKPYRIFVYCLIRDVDESLERINVLRKLKVCPFAQPYRDFDNNIEPTNEQKRLARWCNHKAIFKSIEFKDYKG